MYETRVANTQQLLELVTSARELGFNRQADYNSIAAMADEDGWHVLSVIVPFHTRMMPPEGAHPDPVHHRVQVLMKVVGKTVPEVFILDVTDTQFRMLGTVAEAKAVIAERDADAP